MEIKRIREFNKEFIIDLHSHIDENISAPNPKFFDDDRNILLVAFSGREPLGFLYGYILANIEKETSQIYLYSLDIFEKHRRKKAATKLIEELQKIAKENGCDEIFVGTETNNSPALNLYKKTGGIVESEAVIFVYKI